MTELSERLDRLSPLQRALLAVEQARERIDALERERTEPVAVVGVACRFPAGADGPDAFWRLMTERRHGMDLIPPDRWDRDNYYDPDPDAPGKIYTQHGAFIDRVDEFDAALFRIAPREAAFMDPQQRLLLELGWEALEDAGIAPDGVAGRSVGAFVGISTTDYAHLASTLCDRSHMNAYVGTGNAHSVAANRLSYVLGLQGPSIAVDTACSSSLVAAHLACMSLRADECDLALVCGVNLMLVPETTMNFAKARMLSADGRCRPFDARADGYVRGEGCGVLVLERLGNAEAAGRRVMALIRGSAVNQDGRSNGLTAPHGPSQEEVIRRALRQARVRPAEVEFVEAHGTGTILGDPIEIAALGRALGGERESPALIGSVKANIGHLEAAAGVAGLIKGVLAVEHGEVPPQAEFEQPNPHVDWGSLPVRVATGQSRLSDRAAVGVSSFGFGGTNAHVVLGRPPARSRAAADEATGSVAPVLVKLAGHTSAALIEGARRLSEHVARCAHTPLAAIARTADLGRADLPDRAAVLARTHAELETRLGAVASGEARAGTWRARADSGARPRTAFLVPGQGSRFGGAAADLYRHHPECARIIDELAEVLGPTDRLPLGALLEPGEQSDEALARTEIAQPALYALALALAAFWRAAGVVPFAVLGHSVGAYAAAALAGVFSPAGGARLVAARGRVMAELASGGGMAAVLAAPEAIADVLSKVSQLTVAGRNGPGETIIAGPNGSIATACAQLETRGIKTVVLPVSHAFHSPMMDPALAALEHELRQVQPAAPTVLLISDTTGEVLSEAPDPAYWIRHAHRPVDFTAALETLATLGLGQLIELGPGSTLLALARRHAALGDLVPLPSLQSRRPATEQLLSSVAQAWVHGTSVNWTALIPASEPPARLPTYPFQRRRHWLPRASEDALDAVTNGSSDQTAPADYAAALVPAATDESAMQSEPCTPPPEVSPFTAELFRSEPRLRRSLLLELVRRETARVIGLDGVDEIEEHDGLFALGLDSLMAVDLRRILEKEVGRELPVTLALERPTVGAIADYLLEQLAGAAPDGARHVRRRVSDAEPVAIVGMSCRFPGSAEDLESYWRLLHDGVDAIVPVPPARWDAEAFYDPDPQAPMRMNTRHGGFLAGPVDEFDADMFGISPREAISMDPQQRLLLEVAWEALEDAGVAGELFDSRTGVFIGINTTDYMQLISAAPREDIDAYMATGNTFSVAAGRLSYLLGVHGPSVAVDTACSSSLVAIHFGCASLRSGESDLAVAGGVNLMLSPATSVGMAKLRALSPDGRCKAFDAGADGYGRGEGGGVVVLKRLSEARSDGDRIWAVVRGSAMNHDGRSAGLTVPNGPAQEAVVREALAQGGLDPARVSYVEAHGTGTPLGDPIEMRALGAVLGPGRARPLMVGSVKTNIGHLEAAAGVAGVVKVALAMSHRQIPAHLHVTQPSPFVPWDELPIEVPTETVPWPAGDGPRLAGISSFGFSGTNAHVVLEEPPAAAETPPGQLSEASPPKAELLLLSARAEDALRDSATRFQQMLSSQGEAGFADFCYTAATRRAHYRHRLAVVAHSASDAAERLAAFQRGERRAGVHAAKAPAREPRLIFAFCGQGALGEGAGAGLLAAEPSFRDAMERCDLLVRVQAGWSLIDELRGTPRLEDTEVAQPLLFAIQVALVELWRGWGVEPAAVMGHSVGEIAAAHIAGALSLEAAVRIVVARGRLMQRTKGQGAMAALGLPAGEVREFVARVSIAAINGPSTTIVAGEPDAVEQAVAEAARRQVFARRLPGSYAFHSEQMRPLRDELIRALDGLQSERPRLPIASTVTGKLAAEAAFDAQHWAANMVEPVRFDAALAELIDEGQNIVLEVGPHPALAPVIAQSLDGAGRTGTVLASMRRDAIDEHAVALDALAAMHAAGLTVNHRRRYPSGGRQVRLPGYPWQRRRHWLPEPPTPAARAATRLGGASAPAGTAGRDAAQRRLAEHAYELQWCPAQAPSSSGARAPRGTWLVLGDPDNLGLELSRGLEARGHACKLERALDADAHLPGGEGGGVDGSTKLPPSGIVLLCGAAGADTTSRIDEVVRQECTALLGCVQALSESAHDPPRVWLATRGAQPVAGSGPPPEPAHAPLWGLARVVALEYPQLWGGIVDLDPIPGVGDAEQLLAEIESADFEDQVAYRAGQRHLARLVRTPPEPRPKTIAVRADACYLVTGGRGALGRRIAVWLTEHGARRVVLTGRRDPDAGARATIEQLEREGVTVEVPLVDVADPQAMRELIHGLGAGLRGVIHAAGVFRPQTIDQMTLESLEEVLRPKVAGSWVLHELTRDLTLDFFVMFSSAASVWGSALAGHYVAANHFQDILAHHRRGLGLPGLAINWGWWDGSEMVAAEAKSYFGALGLEQVDDELGMAALEWLLPSPHAQRTVAPVNWARFKPTFSARRPRPLLALIEAGEDAGEPDGGSAEGSALIERLRSLPLEERQAVMVEYLQEQTGEVLGRERSLRLDPELGFFEAGMDSITAVELKTRLESALGVSLPATLAFESPNIAALARHLTEQALQLPTQPTELDDPAAGKPADGSPDLESLDEDELLSLLAREVGVSS